jgi:general secretion pathway protein M
MAHPLTLARQYWHERNARERRLLGIAALVVGLGLLWSIYGWQAAERKRLDHLLPTAQAQVRTMQDNAAELGRLRSQARKPALDSARIAESLQGSAAAQSLPLIIRGDGDRVLVSGSALPFDAWAAWLAAAQNMHGLKVQMLEANREANGLHIEARLTQAQ